MAEFLCTFARTFGVLLIVVALLAGMGAVDAPAEASIAHGYCPNCDRNCGGVTFPPLCYAGGCDLGWVRCAICICGGVTVCSC